MQDKILRFLSAYKSLDNLCMDIFQSDKGITTYIALMEKHKHAWQTESEWGITYRKLKRLRHLRNTLVHDENSFDMQQIDVSDIKWLEEFRVQILECRDPFAKYCKKSRQNTSDESTSQNTPYETYKNGTQFMVALTGAIIVFVFILFAFCINK